MTDEPGPSGQYVQSLARGLSVIRAFGPEHPRMTLSEIAEVTGLSRATARRLLLTLGELGYVRVDGRSFMLAPRVLELGFSYLSGLGLPEIIGPHIEMLSRQLNESASASVLDGGDIVYIARAASRRIMSVSITVGTRFPAHATSMGRVLLAALGDEDLEDYFVSIDRAALTDNTIVESGQLRAILAQVRDQGWALVDQELEPGLRSIAAPVRDREGEVVAAINVSTSTSTVGMECVIDQYLPALQVVAHEISGSLSPV